MRLQWLLLLVFFLNKRCEVTQLCCSNLVPSIYKWEFKSCQCVHIRSFTYARRVTYINTGLQTCFCRQFFPNVLFLLSFSIPELVELQECIAGFQKCRLILSFWTELALKCTMELIHGTDSGLVTSCSQCSWVQPKNTALNDDRNKQNISFECGRYFCQTGVIYATLFLYFGMNTEPLSAFSCSTVIWCFPVHFFFLLDFSIGLCFPFYSSCPSYTLPL